MSSKIDVYEIAKVVHEEIADLYSKDVEAIPEKASKAESEAQISAILHSETSLALKNHMERFVIQLVQMVVDRLDKS